MMNVASRVLSVAALSFFVLGAPVFAGDPPAPKAKAKKAEAAGGKSVAAKTDSAAEGEAAAGSASSTPVAPSPQAPQGARAQPEERTPRPVAATTGTLGFFTVETGETLPKKGFSTSTYVNKFSREPGSVTVLNVGFNAGVGIRDWLSLYGQFEPHRFLHIDRAGRLSFNTPTTNPQFGSTIYRSLTAVPGTPPGYVEDYPFAGHNGGGVGEVTLGLKFGLLSERRGAPVSFSIRNDFIFPTSKEVDLLDNQNQSGQFNYALGLALSKTWTNILSASFNWGWRLTRDPRIAGARALTQAEQVRLGAGFLLFPGSRVQVITEYTGLIFAGDATPNTSFGARDPVDGVWGFRVHPFRNVAVDVGYRYMLNLSRNADRNGFIMKLGAVYWAEKPKPANRPPVAACSADKSSVFAESGEIVHVRVQASDPDGDPLTYSWSATGGRVEGSGTEIRWNSAGLAPGIYTVTVRVDDGRGGTASCGVDIRVEPRPNRPPTMTCSAHRTTVLVGERVRITAIARDPDGDPLTYSWRTNGGQIIGSGASVQLDTSGVAPGSYTVTGRVEDGRGGAADCSVSVNVQAPPAPAQASKLNECFFRHSSARVDNVCKRILDDVALRLQSDPRARVVLVGYADPKEPKPARLASQRGGNAQKYLVTKGIADSRIDVRAATGQAGAGKQNRRIDIIWLPEGATY
jgi:outer membrane protein OmpA-like peptidoglycan-associated protein